LSRHKGKKITLGVQVTFLCDGTERFEQIYS